MNIFQRKAGIFMKPNTQRNPNSSNENILKPVLIGGAIGIAVCILSVLLMPTVLLNFDDPNGLTFIGASVCLALGAITASVTASKKSKNSKLLSGILASATVFLPVLLISFFLPGKLGILNIAIATALTVGFGFLCSYLITKFSANSNKKMKKIMRGR